MRWAVLAIGDGFDYSYPLMIEISNQFKDITFPFWNPYMFSGFPLFGSMQAGIDQGTLYPLLRRLEADGLLQSQWNTEGSRPRRYYVISPSGARLLQALSDEWRGLAAVLNGLLSNQ